MSTPQTAAVIREFSTRAARAALVTSVRASGHSIPHNRALNGNLGLAKLPLMDVLKELFEKHFRTPVARVQALQGQLSGSGRRIIRLRAENASAIGILYDVREENTAFLEFSRHFRRHGLPVPEIYGEDLDHGAYLEQDLGDTTLFDYLSANRNKSK